MKKVLICIYIIFNIYLFPNTIVSTTDFVTKLLIDLNLEKNIIGESGAGDIEFKGVKKISKNLLTKEKLYNIYPDFVIAREGAFTNEKLGTVEELKNIGITPIIIYSSGSNSNIQLFYKDLKTLGETLNIEEYMKNEIQIFKNSLKGRNEPIKNKNIIFISSVQETIGVVGNGGLLKEILKYTKYENVFYNSNLNYFQSPIEKIIEKNIDLIVILGKDEIEWNKKTLTLKKLNVFSSYPEILYLKYLEIAPNMEMNKTIDKLIN